LQPRRMGVEAKSLLQTQYTPTFTFHSARSNFSIVLPDDYAIRNQVLSDLNRYARGWLKAGLNRAPLEMRGLLQVRSYSSSSLAKLIASCLL